jgi:hypothetical protein
MGTARSAGRTRADRLPFDVLAALTLPKFATPLCLSSLADQAAATSFEKLAEKAMPWIEPSVARLTIPPKLCFQNIARFQSSFPRSRCSSKPLPQQPQENRGHEERSSRVGRYRFRQNCRRSDCLDQFGQTARRSRTHRCQFRKTDMITAPHGD